MKKVVSFIFFFSILFSKSFSQQYRPAYHYSPPKNWANDPNGMVYLDGEYHLFFQYNPFGNTPGHLSWGHAVSTDLKNWRTLPVGLSEIQNGDGSTTMIFSGCAVVDSLNTSGFFPKGFKKGLVAIFTSHVDKNGQGLAQHQSLAFSIDKGRTWKMYDKNPVLDIGLKDFRDPNVIWFPEKQSWILTLVKPLDHTVQFYESKNLKDWVLLSEFGKQGDISKIWECPSLTKVPVDGSNESKWVLMVSSGHRQENYLAVQYFVGDFDGKQFEVQKQNEIFYVDEGKDFYASIPFYNLPNKHKKPVLIGWANDWVYASAIPTQTYRGQFSVAREMSLYKESDGTYKLKQKPIIKNGIPTYSANLKPGDKLQTPLAKTNNNSYRLKIKFDLGNAKGFDLHLLKNGSESTILNYDSASQLLSLDRTKSGKTDFHERFPSIETVKLAPEKGSIWLDILVDKSIIEVYGNDGKAIITDLVFPTHNTSGITLVWKN